MWIKTVLIVVIAISLTTGNASALDFSQTVFFGDSLTDSGAFAGNADAGAGERFSTDPGLVWSEILANSFGTTAIANNPNNPDNTDPTGTNYAQGGAQVTSPIGIGQSASPLAAQPLSTQLANYLATNTTANPSALYTVWGGANDVFYNAMMIGGGLPIATATANLNTSAADLSGLVTQLSNSGANTILVPNLPDIGATPSSVLSAISTAGAGNPALGAALTAAVTVLAQSASLPADQAAVQAQALAAAETALGFPAGTLTPVYAQIAGLSTMLTNSYNASLATALAANDANIIAIDINTLLAEAMAAPAEFGFLNVTGVACSTASSLPCTNTELIAPGVNQFFLFADSVHPTRTGHQLLAQYTLSILEAPALISTLAEVPFGIINNHQTTIARHARDTLGTTATGDWALFVDTGYSGQDFDAQQQTMGSDSSARYLMLGLGKKLSDNWLLGVAIQKTSSDIDFDDNRGGFEVDHTQLSAFANFRNDMLFAHLTAGIGLQNGFDDIKRNITLGSGSRVERGHTKGDNVAIVLSAGTNLLNNNTITAGPFGSINYQSIDVDGYSEDGARSTAMTFGSQNRDSLLLEGGIFADFEISEQFTIHTELSREQELKDDDRSLTGALNSLSGQSFSYDNIGVDDGAWKVEIGTNMQVGKRVFLSLTYHVRAGDASNRQSANVGLRVNW